MSDPVRLHRADLDGLRALAVLAVVVHHVAPAAWPGGFAGVDVFFVLSGFLITGRLVAEMDGGRFSWPGFLVRRARRLLPAFVLVVVATLLVGAVTLSASEYSALGWQAVAAACSTANVLFHREVGYFDAAAETKPLLHLWSLGVEEQFYVVWPVILLGCARWRRARLAVTVTLLLASLASAMLLARHAPSAAFYLLPPRAWELLAGGALVLLQRDGRTVAGPSPAGALVAWLGAATLGAGLWLPRADSWPGPATLLPVVGTLLVIAAGPDAPVNRTVLAWRPARWLGLRSYPLYLWHWPALAILRTVAPDVGLDGTETLAAACAFGVLAVVLADLTWRFVERPVQRRWPARPGDRSPTAAGVLPWALPLAALALAGATIVGREGLPQRYASGGADETVVRMHATHREVERAARSGAIECVPASEMMQHSWCIRRGDSVRVAVMGDSHGEGVFAALARALPHEGLLLVGRPGCSPTLLPDTVERDSPEARSRARCRRAVRRAHELIAREGSVRTVVLAARDAYQVAGVPFGLDGTKLPVLPFESDGTRPDTARLATRWEQGMAGTIDRLLRADTRVLLVVDWPELGFDPHRCVADRPRIRRIAAAQCAVPRTAFDARVAAYRAAVSRLAARFPSLVVYDASRPLCDATRCRATAGDTLLYYDDDHLALAGLDRAFAGLVPLLAAPPVVASR